MRGGITMNDIAEGDKPLTTNHGLATRVYPKRSEYKCHIV